MLHIQTWQLLKRSRPTVSIHGCMLAEFIIPWQAADESHIRAYILQERLVSY